MNIRYLSLPLFMLLAGCLSVFLGKELNWDLAHYHFYLPYSVIYNRSILDYWPASYIHQYLNPLIDFLSYFLITHFTSFQTVFIRGALDGISIWLLFLIADFFIPPQKYKTLLCLLMTFLGIYGPTAFEG